MKLKCLLLLVLVSQLFTYILLHQQHWAEVVNNPVNNGAAKRRIVHAGFCKACILYYNNSTATFNVTLVACGDIERNPGPNTEQIHQRDYHSQQSKISYTSAHFLAIRTTCPKLPVSQHTWFTIKNLQINSKPPTHRGIRAGTRKAKHRLNHESTDSDHTSTDSTPVTPPADHPINETTQLGLVNCQSACNKTELIKDHINDYKLDIMALTETWFRSDQDTHP